MKTLFILGGHGDIGSSIVEKFKKEGYEVVAPDSHELDLGNKKQIQDYLTRLRSVPDVIIHAAGINTPKLVEQNTDQDIERIMTVNIFGFYRVMRYFIPLLKKKRQGRILAISSIYGAICRPGRSLYSMSKFALNGFIKTLALELGQYNIIANCLSPGFIDTKLTRKNNSLAVIKSFEDDIPLGRLGKPKEIAEAAYFLCSTQNTYINGQAIIADGGYTIGGFQK